MTDQEFGELLARGYEQRGVEFKGPGRRTDNAFFAKVVRATLGMANIRDGGLVIIGVDEVDNQLVPTGLNLSDRETWNYDDLSAKLAEFADPSVEFDVELCTYEGATFVLIRVHEFLDVPVLCRRDHSNVLRRGGLYVRPRGQPRTSEVPAQADMRDLLDLAAEKRMRRILLTAKEAGLELHRSTDESRFQAEVGPQDDPPVLTQIRQRGHWIVQIRPVRFESDHVELSKLQPILANAAVRLRGWPFPAISSNEQIAVGLNYLWHEFDWYHHLEHWQFFQSGKFVHIGGFKHDWLDRSAVYPPGPDWHAGEHLGIIETLYRCAEVFECAARLSETAAGGEAMFIGITASGTAGRKLVIDATDRSRFIVPPEASIAEMPFERTFQRADLIADPRSHMLEAARWFFERFSYQPSPELLRSLAEDVYSRT